MSEWLEHLGRDTLPVSVVRQFVDWCIWSQARPALLLVLEKLELNDIASAIYDADNLADLEHYSRQANSRIKQLRSSTGPLMLSAAEATTFEFTNMIAAASDSQGDAEDVAFFAARVCGWAAWASTGFSDPTQKTAAEQSARRAQEAHIAQLWQDHGV